MLPEEEAGNSAVGKIHDPVSHSADRSVADLITTTVVQLLVGTR